MSEEKNDVHVAMVFLDRPAFTAPEIFIKHIQRFISEKVVETPSSPDDKQEASDTVCMLNFGPYKGFIGLIEAPIPASQTETLIQSGWHWEDAESAIGSHQAHIIVSLFGGPADPVEANMLLSGITAGVLEALSGIGVLWGGPAISSREMFVEEYRKCQAGDHLPVLSWVSVNILKDGDEFVICTQGMERLGHQEMELLCMPDQAEGAIGLCCDCALYVLLRGPILKNGQTFGRSAEEKFPIIYRPWRWDKTKTAIILDMRPQKRKGFFGRAFGK